MYVLRSMCLCLAVVVVSSDNSTDTPKNPERPVEFIKSCMVEKNFSEDAIIPLSKNSFIPQTQPEKCFIGCYLRKLNIISDGKFSEKGLSELAHGKLGTNQTAVNQGKSILQACANKAQSAGTDECTLAGVFVPCAEEEAHKAGLPGF